MESRKNASSWKMQAGDVRRVGRVRRGVRRVPKSATEHKTSVEECVVPEECSAEENCDGPEMCGAAEKELWR